LQSGGRSLTKSAATVLFYRLNFALMRPCFPPCFAKQNPFFPPQKQDAAVSPDTSRRDGGSPQAGRLSRPPALKFRGRTSKKGPGRTFSLSKICLDHWTKVSRRGFLLGTSSTELAVQGLIEARGCPVIVLAPEPPCEADRRRSTQGFFRSPSFLSSRASVRPPEFRGRDVDDQEVLFAHQRCASELSAQDSFDRPKGPFWFGVPGDTPFLAGFSAFFQTPVGGISRSDFFLSDSPRLLRDFTLSQRRIRSFLTRERTPRLPLPCVH